MGDAFKHQLLRLVLKDAVLLVHQQAQPSLASHRQELAIGSFRPIARGRQLVDLATDGIRSYATAGPSVIDPDSVRGMLVALRRCSRRG